MISDPRYESTWMKFAYFIFHPGSNPPPQNGCRSKSYHGRRKAHPSEYGEPVVLRCGSYRLPLIELLLPYSLSPVEFFRLWPSLPAIAEFTGAYAYESAGPKATATMSGGFMEPAVLPILTGFKSLSSKPFHKVCSHVLRTVAGFQVNP